MSLFYRFILHTTLFAILASSVVFASTEESDSSFMVWGRRGIKPVPPRPEIVPPLVLTALENRTVDSPRTLKAASDLKACEDAFTAIPWGAKDSQQALGHLFTATTKGVGDTWNTPLYQRSFKRLAVRVLLRLLADPQVTFPIELGGYERTQLCCANQAYALALSSMCPDLIAKAGIAFVKSAPECEIYFRGTTRTKSEVLFEAYCGLKDAMRLTKAKVLVQLLKHWDHTPHLRGDEHFTRQDCIETLFDLTQGRRFPIDLRCRVYRTLITHWGLTHAFQRDEYEVDPTYLSALLKRNNRTIALISQASQASSCESVGAPRPFSAPNDTALPACLSGSDPLPGAPSIAFPHARL